MRVVKFKRGQIWWYRSVGSNDGDTYNQGKPRPVIIMSNDLANTHSNCLLAIPVTTQIKKDMPTHTEFKMNGNDCTALAENLMSVNTYKLTEYIGSVDDELLEKLQNNLMIALGLNVVSLNTLSEYPQEIDVETNSSYCLTNLECDKSTEDIVKVKPGRRSKFNSLESKIKYVQDYDNYGVDYVINKYNETSKSAVNNKIYRFKKTIEKESNQ